MWNHLINQENHSWWNHGLFPYPMWVCFMLVHWCQYRYYLHAQPPACGAQTDHAYICLIKEISIHTQSLSFSPTIICKNNSGRNSLSRTRRMSLSMQFKILRQFHCLVSFFQRVLHYTHLKCWDCTCRILSPRC